MGFSEQWLGGKWADLIGFGADTATFDDFEFKGVYFSEIHRSEDYRKKLTSYLGNRSVMWKVSTRPIGVPRSAFASVPKGIVRIHPALVIRS